MGEATLRTGSGVSFGACIGFCKTSATGEATVLDARSGCFSTTGDATTDGATTGEGITGGGAIGEGPAPNPNHRKGLKPPSTPGVVGLAATSDFTGVSSTGAAEDNPVGDMTDSAFSEAAVTSLGLAEGVW